MFVNTKADLGICNLIHDEPLKREYQQSSRYEKMGYEETWVEELEKIVGEVDKKIKRGHQRLAMTQNDSSPSRTNHGPRQEQITQLTVKIGMQQSTYYLYFNVYPTYRMKILCEHR